MNIIIEIGTEEQRKIITQELSLLNPFIENLDPSPTIKQIIIPKEFDKKVNEIQKTNNYVKIK